MEKSVLIFACVLMLGATPYLVLSKYKDAFVERLAYIGIFFGALGLLLKELEGTSVFSSWNPPEAIVVIVCCCALMVVWQALRYAARGK